LAYRSQPFYLSGFHPETVLFRRGGVNPQACLCGVPMYASAQPLDSLATTKNCSFPICKLRCINPEFPDGYYLMSQVTRRSIAIRFAGLFLARPCNRARQSASKKAEKICGIVTSKVAAGRSGAR
jgi:hypothetical protein